MHRMCEAQVEAYGVEYPTQSNIIKEKAKQTNLTRYGNINYNNR